MEFIDKTRLTEKGEAIVNSFLKRLEVGNNNYPNDLYEVFKSDKDEAEQISKEQLIKVLLEEQDNYCCYCMRRLETKEVTLEHLILNSVTEQNEFEGYIKRETVLKNKVCLASEFIKNKQRKTPPFPHTVAYQNLTASCNGNIFPDSKVAHCCNLKRGNKYIEPIVLYSTIKDEIEYKENGNVVWKKDQDFLPLVNVLGLNENVLRMIRRIWLYSKRHDINLGEVKREEFLYKMLGEFSEDEFSEDISQNENLFKMLFNFRQDVYWNLLKEYSYFGK